jgi:hypothetical protein
MGSIAELGRRNVLRGCAVLLVLGSASLPGRATTFALVRSGPMQCERFHPCAVVAICPPGMVSYGGGAIGDQVKLTANYPDASGWFVGFRADINVEEGSAEAYAICGPAPSGYRLVFDKAVPCGPPATTCSADTACGIGEYALAGGMFGSRAVIVSSHEEGDGDTWRVTWFPDVEMYGPGTDSEAFPFTVCASARPDGYEIDDGIEQSCEGPAICTSTLACFDDSKVILGGGFLGSDANPESIGPAASNVWQVGWYPAGPASEGAPQAICATARIIDDELLLGNFDH